MNSLLKTQNLTVHFPIQRGFFKNTVGHVQALTDVHIEVKPQTVVSIVGESGCGKSTLGRALVGLEKATAGAIYFQQEKINWEQNFQNKELRQKIQIIFQDPLNSLNPKQTVFEILARPLMVHQQVSNEALKEKVAKLLESIGLDASMMDRYPHSFSGGQRQRINIARAISLNPELIICDEVVSALDVSIQAQIIHLLMNLKEAQKLSYLFITHDLSLVRMISDYVYVMYLGRVVEEGRPEDLFQNPRHPYTRALMDAIPSLDKNKRPKLLEGELPSPSKVPEGCAFYSRCTVASQECRRVRPQLIHQVACHHPLH